ncbi:exopolyphosphatase-like protein [Xylaria sp. FL1777]|nr:exopolyphosphatase-like protein [Xylaria sp. FL1777]
MPPRASLKTFLATARAALTAHSSKRTTPLTFVVGNESADLDSLCSALLLAYFHTYAPPKKRAAVPEANTGTSSSTTLHIPICHLHRADLALRPEFAAVLRDAGVRGDDVFTLEDVLPHRDAAVAAAGSDKVAAAAVVSPEDTRWLLVDHNAMTGCLASAFAARVVGCVDHHADEGVVPRDASPRVIEKCGSCASLVVERCADGWGALGAGDGDGNGNGVGSGERSRIGSGIRKRREDVVIDAQIARLALAPILVDTANLGDENKTTARDERAVALAEAKIAEAEMVVAAAAAEHATDADDSGSNSSSGGGGGGGIVERYDRNAFFARLSALKEDISNMAFRDVFRKDYKEWSVGGLTLATASVPRGFAYLVGEKARGDGGAFVAALRDWAGEKDARGKMDLLVVLPAFQDVDDGRFRRELLVWARTEAGVRAAKLFEERYADTLRLETWGDGALDENGGGSAELRRCWTQGAVGYGRKQIAPMLRDALKEVSGHE